jgi:hypothetical protein
MHDIADAAGTQRGAQTATSPTDAIRVAGKNKAIAAIAVIIINVTDTATLLSSSCFLYWRQQSRPFPQNRKRKHRLRRRGINRYLLNIISWDFKSQYFLNFFSAGRI